MIRLPKERRCPREGQALVELLVLMPVLLILLLAASDFGKLFVISGKSEVASRYGALRWYRHWPFDQIDTLYPEPGSEVEAAEQLQQVFFEGALNDEEDENDVGYYEMVQGDYAYRPPDLGNAFWNAMLDVFDRDNSVLPIRADRVTFTYNLPFFPYGKSDPMEDEQTSGPLWDETTDTDPLGPYPMITAKGDFVYLAEVFDGGGGQEFMDALMAYGLIQDAGWYTLQIFVAVLFVYILLAIG